MRTTRLAAAGVGACLLCAWGCRERAPALAPPETKAAPHRGGRVVVAIQGDIATFNEYQSSAGVTEGEIIDLLFPTLVTEQPDYQEHPPSFAPRLASSWELSPDGRTLTFKLRRDARWSDGAAVTAADVAFTLRAQQDAEVGSPFVELKSRISACEVVDPVTVRFHFTQAYPYQLMDANDGHIVPAHVWGSVPFPQWRTTDFSERLVTSGPFRAGRHTPNQTLTLTHDPGYWAQPRPFLDEIVFRVIPEPASQVAQLLAGDVDMVTYVPPSEAARVQRRPDLALISVPARLWGFVAWNNRRGPFSDARVRRALGLAINRQAVVDSVYRGFARLAEGPVLSTMWACNRALKPLPFEPVQARALLTEAGFVRGADGVLARAGHALAFDLLYPAGNALRHQAAILIQADLARIGVRVTPLPLEFTTFLARQEAGQFEALLGAWEESTKVDLAPEWSTPAPGRGSNNFIGYSNPEVDRLIAAAATCDLAGVKPVLDRAQELIVADQPVTFLYEAMRLIAIRRNLGGADINAASPFFNVADWYWEK
jgi:peptide/nickel transport system substrate-binding protein